MDEKETIIKEDVELNNKETEKDLKEEFDKILYKLKKMSDAIDLYSNVKDAVSNNKVDKNYLKYIENSIEDKLFCDVKFDKISPKVLVEVVCPELANIEKFEINKLEIEDIGTNFEEKESFIDKICIYDNKLISVFGISTINNDKIIKYEPRKFSRVDIIDAIQEQYEEGKKVQLSQYDEYYICMEENGLKVFSEKKETSLLRVEETIFDKLKSKLSKIFTTNIFSKKTYLPNIELIYDTNRNRFNDIESKSKFNAKSRIKVLLNKEREITRNIG